MTKVPDLFDQYILDFDKALYHAKGPHFPKDIPYAQAYVPIGFFLGFLSEANLLKDDRMAKKKVKQFLTREIRAGELCKFFGGALSPLDLKPEGTVFSYFYYEGSSHDKDVVGVSDVLYLEDYEVVLAKEIVVAGHVYLIEDTWGNYEKVKQRIQERFDAWINSGAPKPHYRDFKSLDDAEKKQVETYVKNKLASGLFSKTFPEVHIEEPSFRSYLIKVKGPEIGKKFYTNEEAMREYLKKFTDKAILFQIE